MINDVLYIIHFISIIGVFFYNIYYLMKGKEDRNLIFKSSIIGFIINLLAWFFGIVVVSLEYETILYAQVFKLTTLLFLLNVLFFIIGLFLYVGSLANTTIKPFKSRSNK